MSTGKGGHTYVHSHPYTSGDASDPGHAHSSCDLLCLGQLSFLNLILPPALAWATAVWILLTVVVIRLRLLIRRLRLSSLFLRGPPLRPTATC